jgi:hypothetical protein
MIIKMPKTDKELLDESLNNIEREIKKEGFVSAPTIDVEKPHYGDVNYMYEGFQVKITQIDGVWTGLAYRKEGKRGVTFTTDSKLYYSDAGKEIKRYIDAYNRSN